MANTRRPSLTPKAPTKKAQTERDEALNTGITIAIPEGPRKGSYTVSAGDLSALDVRALRREHGLSFRGLMLALKSDPDIDLIAAIVWLSVRARGDQSLTFEDVAADLDYATDFDIDESTAGADPEAAGGSS